jgi:hypothetical protein
MSAQPDSAPGMKAGQIPQADGVVQLNEFSRPVSPNQRKKLVVVGLGMVGIAFM